MTRSLRRFATLLAFTALISITSARTWTSADGSNTFEGELQSYDADTGKVTVKTIKRGEITFKQDFLSEADIEYLQKEGTKISGGGSSLTVASVPDELPAPDGEEADMSKPVQVFIIMGQSNTLEMGKVKEGLKEKYPYLADDSGEWTTRKDVRNFHHQSGKVRRDDWLTISGRKIGIEIGIGHYLGHAIEAPVMILKSSIGNRSLGWDLLPPSVGPYEHNGKPQPGYGEDKNNIGKGTNDGGWYAGKQWDTDIGGAQEALKNLGKHYPGAEDYKVAGFLWWQGDKDMRNPAHFNNYEKHMVALIKDLRKTFDAPSAPFVTASLGQTKESDTSSGHGIILQAMKTVASGKYSDELGDNIGFVYTHELAKHKGSSGHYGGDAEVYMNVGEAMGKEMIEQLAK